MQKNTSVPLIFWNCCTVNGGVITVTAWNNSTSGILFKFGAGLIFPAVILIIWLVGARYALWNSYVIPPPTAVALTLEQLVTSGLLLQHIGISLYRVFAGFSLALLLAFPLGVLFGMQSGWKPFVEPSLEMLRHIPPLAALPMLILWFGIGEFPKLLIVVLATFFPIFLNTLHGVGNCDKKWLEVARSFQLNRRQVFRRIIFPAALPSVLVGMRLGLGYSWRALVGAELIAAASGIGYMILDAEQLSRPDIILIGIFTIGIVGTVIDGLFFRLTTKLIPWQTAAEVDYGRG